MGKRARRREQGIGWSDDAPATSAQDVTAEAYNLDIGAGKRVSVKNLDIFNIRPDPAQPRRAVPWVIRQAVAQVEPPALNYPSSLIQTWLDDSPHIDVYALLEQDNHTPVLPHDEELFPREDDGWLPHERALLNLIDLAASIRRDGLANPITVEKRDRSYIIETGERRWLAYHLLYSCYESERDKWGEIPARVVDASDVWRQAHENSSRADLNGVAQARQFALLLMDIYHKERGATFHPVDQFEMEQDFYAQVADGETWPIPRGKGDKLLSAMGLKRGEQLRRLRDILRVPYEFWQFADDNNLTEFEIRKAKADDFSVPHGTLTAENTPDGKGNQAPHEAQEAASPSWIDKVATRSLNYQATLEKQKKYAKDPDTRAQLRHMVQEQIAWLQQFKDELDALE